MSSMSYVKCKLMSRSVNFCQARPNQRRISQTPKSTTPIHTYIHYFNNTFKASFTCSSIDSPSGKLAIALSASDGENLRDNNACFTSSLFPFFFEVLGLLFSCKSLTEGSYFLLRKPTNSFIYSSSSPKYRSVFSIFPFKSKYPKMSPTNNPTTNRINKVMDYSLTLAIYSFE